MTTSENIGCYNLLVFYPAHLHLEEGKAFLIDYNGIRFSVCPMRHIKSLTINDFDNSIVTDEDNKINFKNSDFSFSKATVQIDFNTDYFYVVDSYARDYREFYSVQYTEMLIGFESMKSQDNLAKAIQALKYFIDCYRSITNDILTLPYNKNPNRSFIHREGFHEYTQEDMKKSHDDRLLATRGMKMGIRQIKFPNWHTHGRTFETDPAKNGADVKAFFKENRKIEPLARFVLTAKEEFHIHGNYKVSLLESWISIEMSIVQILNKIKLSRGISKNKISDFASKIGISYLLNIELPLVFSGNDENFKILITRVDNVRKIRNKVIHENKDVSREEAKLALDAAVDLLNFLGYKKINY